MSVLGPLFLLLSVLIGCMLYLTPTMVACGRDHPHQKLIIAANVLAGWTVLFWIGCLIWASLPIPQSEE